MSCDCGGLKPLTLAPPTSVQEVIPAANIVAGWDAAVTTNDGTSVSEMFDVSGNGFTLTQAVAGNQPLIQPAGGPNGNPSVLFDGVDDFLFNATLDFSPPGTTPAFLWVIARQVTWDGASFDALCEAGALPDTDGGINLNQQGVTPQVSQYMGSDANLNAALILNTYKRLQVFFNNDTDDYLQVGSVKVTGQNAGNLEPGPGFTVGAGFEGSYGWGNWELCEMWIFNAEPTAIQKTKLDAYAASRYGAGVLT